MKISFFELEGWEEKLIREALPGQEVFFNQAQLDKFYTPEAIDSEVVSVFVDSRIDSAMLDYFPKLKLIATRSTGYDHIDLKACRARGITVAYVPGYGDNTVAEFTFGLILALTRKIYQSIDQVKKAELFTLKGLRGMDLKGKTLGVVGTGRIGKEVVRIARGFSMNVLAFDLYPDDKYSKEMGFLYVDFPRLLKNSDIVTFHCPYNAQTHHLLSAATAASVKPGSYLVNTSRGAVVDTQVLVELLQNGILAGAALDVLEEEGETKDEMQFLSKTYPKAEELKTILRNHILMRLPNVLITPHNAFNSQEALERILKITIENIRSYADGRPSNVVPVT